MVQFECPKHSKPSVSSRDFSLFPLLALWGNENGPPSMKVEKVEQFRNKKGLMDCKWSSLNAPGTRNPLSHLNLVLCDFPLFPLLTLWGNENGPPSMKVEKVEQFRNKKCLMSCKWSRLNAPGTGNLLSPLILELYDFPFSSGVIRIGLPV